ncbi:MAG: serine/threonine-protein kinase [Patescibacteria group bacterium]
MADKIIPEEPLVNLDASNSIRIIEQTSDGKENASKYSMLYMIGSGGMGEVFLAWDQSQERHVIIKTVNRSLPSPREEFYENLETEAKLVAKLVHPNIAIVYDILIAKMPGVIDEAEPMIVTEYIKGDTLEKFINSSYKQEKHLNPNLVSKIITQVADAIEYSHSQRVYHRDPKPENIIITDNGSRAVLIDYGLAPVTKEMNSDYILGSPGYISPEVALGTGDPDNLQSVVFQLGVITFESLTGKRPFGGDNASGEKGVELLNILSVTESMKTELLKTLPNEIRNKVEKVLTKALEKNPKNRYQTPLEFAKALNQATLSLSAR